MGISGLSRPPKSVDFLFQTGNSRRTGLNGHARAYSKTAVSPFRLVLRSDSSQDKAESRLQDERRRD